jgi:tetratricopeptide (TPR) repeat protein
VPSTARRVRASRRRGDRSRLLALGLAGALIAVAVAAIAIAFGPAGEDGSPSPQGDSRRADRPQASAPKRDRPDRGANPEAAAPQAEQPTPQEQAPATPAPAPAPEEEQPEATEQQAGSGPATGARLNDQGFQLMSEGRYDEAIPILQRAVNSFPAGTTDLNYAYALFNLGQALRLAGRPDEAIPILEQRLEIPNQTGTVRRELELARRDAGGD